MVWIVLESKTMQDPTYDQNFAILKHYGATLTHLRVETPFSMANSILMIAGDTFGVGADLNPLLHQNHLGDLLEAQGLDWRVYAEDYPSLCFTGAQSHHYIRRNIPFLAFSNVAEDPKRCKKVTTAQTFANDLRLGKLPAFTMYVPNQLNNGHDTTIAYAGKWLTKNMGNFLYDAKDAGDTLFVVTFTKNGNATNHLYTVLIAPTIKPGVEVKSPTKHASILRMIEDELNLGNLGRADAEEIPISGIWK